MEEVYPRIWIGDDGDYDKIKDRPNWSVVRCCKYGPGGHQQTLGYTTLAAPDGPNKYWVQRKNKLALNMLDLDDPNFVSDSMMDKAFSFIKDRWEAGDIVLIACNHGASRGPSVAFLYLRSIGQYPYAMIVAERFFRTIYPKYDPAQGIRQYVRMHWGDWAYQERRVHGR